MNTIKPIIIGLLTFITSISGSIAPVINQTQPIQKTLQPTAAANADISRNWSGYTTTTGNFTGVSATWTIPQIANNNGNKLGTDATWVGIGGVDTHDLIQAGTQEIIGRDGQVAYNAFYETLPYSSRPLEVSVKGGDSVTVSLTQQSTGIWHISFKNNTSGQSTSMNQQYDSSLSSADWIEEAPSSIRRILPLDNFGTIEFTNASAIKNGQTVNLAEANAKAISMGSYGQTIATTSVLGTDNASFTVTSTNSITDPNPPPSDYAFGGTSRRSFRRNRISVGNPPGYIIFRRTYRNF